MENENEFRERRTVVIYLSIPFLIPKGEDDRTTELYMEIHLHHNTKRHYHLNIRLSQVASRMLGKRRRESYPMARHR